MSNVRHAHKYRGCDSVADPVHWELDRGASPTNFLAVHVSLAVRHTDAQNRFRTDLVACLPRLHRFGLTLTRNRSDADDLVQTVCEKAIQNADSWQVGTRLDSWLFTMMRNTWISELRKRSVRVGAGQEDAGESDALNTPVTPEDEAYGKQLLGLIHGLPEGLSSVLLLVSVEGYSYQDAADILDIPIGTVMSRMSNARKRLRAALAATGTQ